MTATPVYTRTFTSTPTKTSTYTVTPTVTSTLTPIVFARDILPANGAANTTTQVTLIGKGLSSAPSVKLAGTGLPEIVAANVAAKSNVLFSCTFNLASAVAGFYDLHLDMSGSTAIMSRAFQVLLSNSMPLVWSAPDLGAIPVAPVVTGIQSGVAVADVNNDNQLEVYATNRNASFFKFSGSGASWACQNIATGAAQNFNDILAADLDYDGVKELYLAGQDSTGGTNHRVYRYKYNGSSYQQSGILGAASGKLISQTYGDGNNDGDLELYAGSSDGHVYQYQYNGTAWAQTDLGQPAATPIHGLLVADGDSDNQLEIYAAGEDKNVYAYKSGAWAAMVTLPGIAYSLAASDQDQDNNHYPELYAACEDKNVYQIKKASFTSWDLTAIAAGGDVMYQVIAANGDSTGRERLYAGNGDGHVYQISLENGQWVKNDCGSLGRSVYGLAAGDGDNDNRYELFAAGANNHVYMFKPLSLNPTPTITPTLEVTPTITPTSQPRIAGFAGQIIDAKFFYVAPNPTQGTNVNFRFFLKQAAEVEIRIYTPQGSHVWDVRRNDYPQGWNSAVWNASGMANGVYFYIAEAKTGSGKEKIKKTICLVK